MEKRMHNRRYLSFLSAVILVLLFASCKETAQQKHYENKSLTLLKEQNYEGLYDLFSKELKETTEFEQNLYDFLDELYAYNLDFSVVKKHDGGESKTIRQGKTEFFSGGVILANLFDSEGNEFEILIRYIVVDKNHPDKEGIRFIQLSSVIQLEHYPQYTTLMCLGYENKDSKEITYYDIKNDT